MTGKRIKKYQEDRDCSFSAFYNNSIDAILLTSPDGSIYAANPSACRLFGFTEEEICRVGRAGLIDHTDPHLAGLLEERARTGSVTGELRFRRSDGSIFTAEISSALFTDSSGEVRTTMIIRDITGRKKLEEEIIKSEEQYRRLFMDNPQPMWIFDLETLAFLEVNNAAVKHYGYSRDEFRAMTLKDIRPDEDVDSLLKDIELAKADRSPDSEWRHLKKDGEQIIVQIVAHSITYHQRPARHVMITDVTYRRKMEEALRASELKFRKLYEEGPYGMVLVGTDSRFLMANRTFCAITGYSESELKALSFLDITYPDDVGEGDEAYRKMKEGKIDVYRSEKRYIKKDGSVMWGSVTVTVNYNERRQYLYSLGIVEDITERKKSEDNIKLLNKRLGLLIEAIQQLSTATRLESVMDTVKGTVRKLLNADGATFILRDNDQSWYADEYAIAPLWKGQRFPLTACVSGWSMLNKKAAVIEDIYSDPRVPVPAYKSTFVKSMAMAPIRISDPLGAIGAYWKDRYSPSEAEVQLLQTLADAAAKAVENLQLIEGLEHKISERTAELQALNKELESFSYSVSHDLRAPLRHINGFSEILIGKYAENLPEEAIRHLNTIISSAQMMGTLIDDLLNLSRTGRAELNKTTVSMNRVVQDVRSYLEPRLAGRDIEWHTGDLPDCFCDANLIRQAWINLAENAVKYTRTREKAIIKIGHRAENGESVYFISDNGVGFDMKYAQNLFGVFQRLHSPSEFEGTGIGLANVLRIITRHGGRVWAEAEPGRGATFFFTLTAK